VLYLLYGIHVIVCIFLILVVLLQQGKGADLSVFGGGSTQTAFGARSATTLLHKLTVTSFVLFIFTTLLIGIMQGGADRATLMSDVVGQPTTEEAAPADTDQAADQPAASGDQATPSDQGAPDGADGDGGGQ
jgi:preprotein translocase subunit SecG